MTNSRGGDGVLGDKDKADESAPAGLDNLAVAAVVVGWGRGGGVQQQDGLFSTLTQDCKFPRLPSNL